MKVNMRIGTRILAGYGLALVVVGTLALSRTAARRSLWTARIGSRTRTK